MRPGYFIQSGIRGLERDQALKVISKFLPFSIILFKKDFTSKNDLMNLIKEIKRIYRIENNVLDPVIAVDQEGGNVVRLPWLDYNPSNLFLGELNNPAFTRYVGLLTGYQLSKLGILWNLAPVLDVLNPYNQSVLERSFGYDVEKIALHGFSYILGLQLNGVHGTAKHFPGHGGVLEDSHLVLPVDKRNYEAIINDAYPFRKAITVGVDSIMLSHVLYQSIDPDKPSSISPIIQNLLRKNFNFSGIIITDSIDMKALSDNFSKEEIVKYTLNYDVDVILSANIEDSVEIVEYISKIDNIKMKEKVERISKFINKKVKRLINPGNTLLKSVEMTFPIVRRKAFIDPNKRIYVVFLDYKPESNVQDELQLEKQIVKDLKNLKLNFEFLYGLDSLIKINKNSQVVFIGRNENLKNRVWKINEFCKYNKCAFISTGVDRDIGILDENIGYVSAFSSKPRVITGAMAKIVGYL